MPTFKKTYRETFLAFGYPLTASAAVKSKALTAAENRLGIKVPPALRDYYLVAGRERRFNQCFNRLLPTSEWWIDKRRLIFMEENQSVVWWGVNVSGAATPDPVVFQGINEESIAWYSERRKCSMFLAVVLHYQAVSGGLPYCGCADAPETSDYRFEKHGWTYYGEINSLSAYSRQNQVVCLMPPAPFHENWSVLAGGKTKSDLRAIASELAIVIK